MKKALIGSIFIISVVLSAPLSFAMSETDCQTLWKKADANGDGKLTGGEAKPFMTAMVAGDVNTMGETLEVGEFLNACLAGDFNDTITGSAAANRLDGGTGNDALDGGVGNDTLNGGDDSDSINGGDGNDLLNGGVAGGPAELPFLSRSTYLPRPSSPAKLCVADVRKTSLYVILIWSAPLGSPVSPGSLFSTRLLSNPSRV